MGLFIGDNAPSKIFVGDTPISKVFLGDTQVRPSGWQPGANTLLYCPFTEDLDNHSLQSYNIISSTNASITTLNGLKCASFSDGYLIFPDINIFNGVYTIILWRKLIEASGASPFIYVSKGIGSNNRYYAFWEGGRTYQINSSYRLNDLKVYPTQPSYPSAWECLITTVDSSNLGKIYKNGDLLGSKDFGTGRNVASGNLHIGTDASAIDYGKYIGYLSNLIIENRTWSTAEITEYYNQTKSNYGL